MKAKEWIKALVLLAQAGEDGYEAFSDQVNALAVECQAIVNTRLATLKPAPARFSSRGDRSEHEERRCAAYREGLVKWDAVVHGVALALGTQPPFPLFRGALLVQDLSKVGDRLRLQAITKDQAMSEVAALEAVIRGMGYHETPVFTSLLEMVHNQIHNLTLVSILELTDDLKEFQTLATQGKLGTARGQQLQSRLLYMRVQLNDAIRSLPLEQKLQAFYLLGSNLS